MQDNQNPKMGRPRKEIDVDQFEKLCAIQCTLEEVAAYFDMDSDTLNERMKEIYGGTFSDVFKVKRQKGFVSLRRSQFNKALEGDNTMLIFLGKNYLKQRDRAPEEEQSKTDPDLLAKLVELLNNKKNE